jgi:hypothetical protein
MPHHGHGWNGWVRRLRLQTLSCACVALLRRTARHDKLADEWQPCAGSLLRLGNAVRTRAPRARALRAAPTCKRNADGYWSASRDPPRAAQRHSRLDMCAARVMKRWTRIETHVQRSSCPVPFRSRRRSACSASKSAPFLAQRVRLDFDMLSQPCKWACNTPETGAARR